MPSISVDNRNIIYKLPLGRDTDEDIHQKAAGNVIVF